MIRIGFLADTHLGFDLPAHPRIQRRRRGLDFQANYERALEEMVATGVDFILHGGDLFFRSRIPDFVQALAYEPLLGVADAGIHVYLVPGNHERSRLPWSPLFSHPNIHVFDMPRTFVHLCKGERVALGGFPFIRHRLNENWERAVVEAEILNTAAELRLLCVHQAFHGARVGPVNFTFRKGPDVVGLDQIPEDIDLVLSGHIHRRQQLPAEDPRVVFPGSIERTAFAEKEETKGYSLITFRPINGGWRKEVLWVDLPARPMFVLDLPAHLTGNPDLEDFVRQALAGYPEDAIVRLRPGHEQVFPGIQAATLRTWAPASMNLEWQPPRNPSR